MSSYMISRAGEQFGPYSEEDLRGYLGSGQVLPDDLAWTEGMAGWVPVSQIFPTGSQYQNNSSELASVSESWKKKFALIEKAGGPKLPKIRDLSFAERMAAFNWLGGIFCWIYYLIKGMWRKAITLTVLCVVVSLILDLVLSVAGFPKLADKLVMVLPIAIFGTRANIDFYKKVVLGDNGWW